MSESDYIEQVFGAGGIFAGAFAQYEARAGQVKAARAVDRAIQEGQNLLAEAPTGVGKSIAYGVPASWWAAKENDQRSALGLPRRRVVIVTANIALQEQLVGKDLPMLAKLMPWRFSFALLKGMQNYACLDRFDDTGAERMMVTVPDERRQLLAVEKWIATTEKGDLSELPFELAQRIRQLVVVGQDDCLGKACPRRDDCFGRKARRASQDADIVVTNFHMFFLDLKLRMVSEGAASVIPDYDVVVFDEAHKAADIARDFFGFRVTRGQVLAAARLLWADATPEKPEVRIDSALKAHIAELGSAYFRAIARYAHSEAYVSRIQEKRAVPSDELEQALRLAASAYGEYQRNASPGAARMQELTHAIARCEVIADALRSARLLEGQERGNAYFIEALENADYGKLVMKPLSVADKLRTHLFESAGVRAVVMMSATLTVSGRFDFAASELGCETADEIVAESPFDWASQCLMVQPTLRTGGRSIPMPTATTFADEIAQGMVDVAEASDGRMLGLFTSYRVMDRAHRAFLARGWGERVMRQGEQPRTQLVQRLKDEPGMVLLGVESFWAGIDVPGDALSVVAIDRLPFPNPDDPLLDAFETVHRGRGFKDYSLPRAVIALRQGFGRLIRTATDRGVVVVFDRRLTEKGFGRSFLKSLPAGVRMSRDFEDIGRFLQRPLPKRATG
jgi:ATP-dependent DNA helicase DinG